MPSLIRSRILLLRFHQNAEISYNILARDRYILIWCQYEQFAASYCIKYCIKMELSYIQYYKQIYMTFEFLLIFTFDVPTAILSQIKAQLFEEYSLFFLSEGRSIAMMLSSSIKQS